MQQLLSYPIREVANPHDAAAVKQNQFYKLELPDSSVIKALNAGIWTDNFDIKPTCTPGNCMWAVFQSVDFYSKCEDITSTTTLLGCTNGNYHPNMTSTQGNTCATILQNGWSMSITILARDQGDGGSSVNVPKDVIWGSSHLSGVDPKKTSYVGVNKPLFTFAHAKICFYYC
ncbi:hypothetical protein BDV23DRAFT_187942 [Aspergillus alliaceus]|uniref:Uncharacterized protein n=1 Tax=Petromyces alliaceus TaxID=209559 RepID=A0A5N7BVE2_PETAA|nr:hypothetical protein BDV23DRAFT_187942 [Aspergillus alliaceus]